MATGHPKCLHWQVDTLDWSSWYPGSLVLNRMVHLGDSHPLGQWVAARRTGAPITWSSLSQCSLFKSQGSTTVLRFAEPTSCTEDNAIREPNWANCGQKQGGKAPSLGGKMVIRPSKSRVGQCRALNKLSVRKEKLKSRVTEHGPLGHYEASTTSGDFNCRILTSAIVTLPHRVFHKWYERLVPNKSLTHGHEASSRGTSWAGHSSFHPFDVFKVQKLPSGSLSSCVAPASPDLLVQKKAGSLPMVPTLVPSSDSHVMGA